LTEHVNELRRLSRIRAVKKKQKPDFQTTNSWRHLRVAKRWRRPRGIDNKMRERIKGWPQVVKIGYKKPKKMRHKYFSGTEALEEFLVSNLSDLDLVLPHKHVVRIDGKLGTRKKEQIYQEAISWGLKVLNPIQARETFEEELTEDLSLDRDLGLDLDLEDVEDVEDLEDKK
jgi:large subunit ribosomal protein L32e